MITPAQERILNEIQTAIEVFVPTGRQVRSCEKLCEEGLLVFAGTVTHQKGSTLHISRTYGMGLGLRRRRGLKDLQLDLRKWDALESLARSPWNWPVASVSTTALSDEEVDTLAACFEMPGIKVCRKNKVPGACIQVSLTRVGDGVYDEETEDSALIRKKYYHAIRDFYT